MNSTDASAGKESGNGLPGHWHVDGDGVTLLNSHTLEDIGNGANLAEKLGKSDFTATIRLISFIDDCGLFEEVPVSSRSNITMEREEMGEIFWT